MPAYKVHLTLDRAAVLREGADLIYREIVDVTRRVFNRANVLTPVDTGRLRAGNQMRTKRSSTGGQGEVFNLTAYADPVHDGTAAYVVRPRRAKALRFVVGGRVVYAMSARIPGRRGRPWILRALKEVAAHKGYTVTT